MDRGRGTCFVLFIDSDTDTGRKFKLLCRVSMSTVTEHGPKRRLHGLTMRSHENSIGFTTRKHENSITDTDRRLTINGRNILKLGGNIEYCPYKLLHSDTDVYTSIG